jgi:DNA-binding NarL/FixJ family response regulator
MAYLKNPDELSEVEIKVLLGTCYGVGDSTIAKMIRKSNRTVERYRKYLCEKLNVRDADELVKVSTQLFKLNGHG